jgi:hypothetical protein
VPLKVIAADCSITTEDGTRHPPKEPIVWHSGSVATDLATKIPAHLLHENGLPQTPRPYKGQKLNGESVLLMRAGGFGDLIMLTPIVREITRRGGVVSIATRPKHRAGIETCEHVRSLVWLPVPLAQFKTFDFYVEFEGTIESEPRNALTVFAERAGVMPLLDRRVEYRVPEFSIRRVKMWLESKSILVPGRLLVVMQARASAIKRTYPPEHSANVAWALVSKGANVAVLGSEGEFPSEMVALPGVFNLCGIFKSIHSIHDSAAVVKLSSLVICPDSSFSHIAAALSIPSIVIHGPVPPSARVADYPLARALYAPPRCAPCMDHRPGPCVEAQRTGEQLSPCMTKIPPDHVIDLALKILKSGMPSKTN